MSKKLASILLLTIVALVSVVAAKPKRLMVLNRADFDLSGGQFKMTAQFTNLTKKPLAKVYLAVKCVDAAGNPVVGTEDEVTAQNHQIAPGVPGSYILTRSGGFPTGLIKSCSCSLSVEKDGKRLEQDTYSVQIK